MRKRGDSRKILTVALALGVLVNAGGKLAFAEDRHLTDAARPAAIYDCNTKAEKWAAFWLVGKFCSVVCA